MPACAASPLYLRRYVNKCKIFGEIISPKDVVAYCYYIPTSGHKSAHFRPRSRDLTPSAFTSDPRPPESLESPGQRACRTVTILFLGMILPNACCPRIFNRLQMEPQSTGHLEGRKITSKTSTHSQLCAHVFLTHLFSYHISK